MVNLLTSTQKALKMAVHQSELTPVELESFADESKMVCLFHVIRGDKMMVEKVKLQSAEQPS